jgi:ABC-type multidrug transport system ATPase subunit
MSEVVLERVSINNEQGLPVLMGISAVLRTGEAVAVVGRAGSGKTMLLRAIAGLVPLRGGRIRIDGADLWKQPYATQQRQKTRTGFVLELNGLVGNMSLGDNLLLPASYHTDLALPADAVRAIAEEFEIEHALGQGVAAANASVRKRALFARALVLEPSLLLVDMPQRGLNLREANVVSAAIDRRRASRSMTVVYADHDGNLEPYVIDRCLVLEKGTLVAGDKPAPASRNASYLPTEG